MGCRAGLPGAFFLQSRPLVHPEPVLFIRDHQAELMIIHVFADQCVCAEYSLAAAGFQLRQDRFPFLCLCAAGQQPAGDSRRFQKLFGVPVMLLCQDLCRSHHACLDTGLTGHIDSAEGNRRFSAAHIALHQPGHGGILPQVFRDLIQHPFLGRSRRKRKQFPVFFRAMIRSVQRNRRLPVASIHGDIKQVDEHSLKRKPAPGNPQVGFTGRKMGLPDRKIQFAQPVPEAEFIRQRFRAAVVHIVQRHADQFAEGSRRNLPDRPVNGSPSGLRHNHGILQHPPSVFDIHPPVKHDLIPGADIFGHPRLVEPADGHFPGRIGNRACNTGKTVKIAELQGFLKRSPDHHRPFLPGRARIHRAVILIPDRKRIQ